MQKIKNPPNLYAFAEVYIKIYDKILKEIEGEIALIKDLETNLSQIDRWIDYTWRIGIINKQQLVFRVSEMLYFKNPDPLFKIVLENGHETIVIFHEFYNGDIFIDVPNKSNYARVIILERSDASETYSFDIQFDQLKSKKRYHRSQEICNKEIYYEVQLINNMLDYYSELQFLTQERYEYHLAHKNCLAEKLALLTDLFPSFHLNESGALFRKLSISNISTNISSYNSFLVNKKSKSLMDGNLSFSIDNFDNHLTNETFLSKIKTSSNICDKHKDSFMT